MSVWETAWAAVGQPVGDEGPTRGLSRPCSRWPGRMRHRQRRHDHASVPRRRHLQRQRPAELRGFALAVPTGVSERQPTRFGKVLEDVVNTALASTPRFRAIKLPAKPARPKRARSRRQLVCRLCPADDPQVVVAIVLEQAVDSEYSDNAALKSQEMFYKLLYKSRAFCRMMYGDDSCGP